MILLIISFFLKFLHKGVFDRFLHVHFFILHRLSLKVKGLKRIEGHILLETQQIQPLKSKKERIILVLISKPANHTEAAHYVLNMNRDPMALLQAEFDQGGYLVSGAEKHK